MKRLLLLLIVLVFSLQSPWAAAAAYCTHEKGVAAVHFGHHDHKHRVSSADLAGEQLSWDGSSHVDCGVCHLTSCKLSQYSFVLPQLDSVSWAGGAARNLRPSFIPEGPERPSWSVLV